MTAHGGTRSGVPVGAPTVGLIGQFALLVVLRPGIVGWLAGAGYAVAGWALLTIAVRRAGLGSFGPANWITLVRAVLVGGAAALVVDSIGGRAPVAVLVTIGTAALILDAVDGVAARLTGTSSALGARFDMETDACLILVLSVYVAGQYGAWVLAIGLMRYAYVAAYRLLPWLRRPLPPRYSAKVVAAVQGVVLMAAVAGVLPHTPMLAAIVASLALLVWSFGRDIGLLWRMDRAATDARRMRTLPDTSTVVR